MRHRIRAAAATVAAAGLLTLVGTPPANAHTGSCTTGSIPETVHVASQGSYVGAAGTYADNVTTSGYNPNDLALDVDLDVFDNLGNRLWGITEYRDTDGTFARTIGDVRLNNKPYLRAVFDRGTYWADCTVRLSIHG